MSRTYRKVPKHKWLRTPRYKWKLQAGISRKQVVTDFDDKGIAAKREQHGN
jgi:hypothetical protein